MGRNPKPFWRDRVIPASGEQKVESAGMVPGSFVRETMFKTTNLIGETFNVKNS